MVTRIPQNYPTHKQVRKKKYIKIPKYGPLYAMVKCNGPTTAPIKTPIAVPLDIIGELLSQRFNTPEIYEVVPIDVGHGKFTDPVRLTLENYRKPYAELIDSSFNVAIPGVKPDVKTVTAEPAKKDEPELITEKNKEAEQGTVEETATDAEPEIVEEDSVEEPAQEEETIPTEEAPESAPVEIVSEPNVTVITSEDSENEEDEDADVMAEYDEPVTGVTEVDVIPKTENEETINYTSKNKKKRNRHK